ncbi:hypothetical protein BP00DRAFT_425104, partial [Aspergillus indologenus CBS 114.80]
MRGQKEAPLFAHRCSLQVELVPELLARLRTEIGINKMLVAYGITEMIPAISVTFVTGLDDSGVESSPYRGQG